MTILHETAEKIKNMEIRGAGRIARAAALALKDEAKSIDTDSLDEFNAKMKAAYKLLYQTRPTAVSLPNALRIVMRYKASTVAEARSQIIANADAFVTGSENAVKRIGEIGARRIKDDFTIMTHCNSSAAAQIIQTAFKSKKNISVIATETRPRMQGYVTVDVMQKAGIPTTLILDSAVRYFMKKVDAVVVGADAITVNGNLINKVGTSQLALAAHEARVPFIVAAETYKFSPRTLLGELVEIEERDPSEVLSPEMQKKWPNLKIANPAFDITPHSYIDLICTEIGAIPPEMAYWVITEKLGWEIEEADENIM
ncbi:ribose 1,5-bisphosphate isomerase [Methanocella arvoryzae]|uniref:Ribose 1,5-bisphosphate isomerase n=1 Tax=Methanocella arvoryzae (strain DSM 22066 / NBRC 105507 / MRE50) TaxID=351160 RepID=Q0W0H9_METAR|nr:ribose 1,5-bisphosphate isomerase [Methanocella arvoryzae]CAJ38114.1 translation initiation factor 2B, subunit 2 [Methanocella arvoryzae MRE50]